MSPVNEGVFDKPPRQQSFVARMALRTKSKVHNLKSYKTISLLPKLFKPDSKSWMQFEQDTTEFANLPDQETSQSAPVDVAGPGIVVDSTSPPQTTSRNSSIKDRFLQARLFSPPSCAKLNNTFDTRQFGSESSNSSSLPPNYVGKKDIGFDLGETSLSESVSRISSDVIISIPDNDKKKAEWESTMKKQSGKIVDGFWEECKVEMNKTWQIFTGETTAHGYKRTMAQHRCMMGRLFWAAAILAVSGIAMTLLYNTVVQQDLNSFSSSIKSQPSVEMTFPAVTICNLASYDFSKVEDTSLSNYSEQVRQFLQQVSDLQNFELIPLDSETLQLFQQFDTKDLHDLIGWKLENFIKKCSWNEMQISCSEIFVQSKIVTEGCFTFNFDPNNLKSTNRDGSLSGLSLIIDIGGNRHGVLNRVPSGMKVILHEPQDLPNTREQGMLVASGTTTYMSITKNEYKFLSKPFKAYGTAYCLDQTVQDYDGVHAHKQRYYNYTGYSSCLAECRLRVLVDKCGCMVYGRDPEIAGLPYCSMDNYTTCYIPTLRNTYMQSPDCGCSLPCHKIEYASQMSSALFRRNSEGLTFLNMNDSQTGGDNQEDVGNFVELNIFYKELLTHIEEHVAMYTWLTIFGNVGGQLGLFTGASVLTVLEFMEFFAVIVWMVVIATYRRVQVRWRSRTHHIRGHLKPETGHIQGTWRPEI